MTREFYAAQIIWRAKRHKAEAKYRDKVRQRNLKAIAQRKIMLNSVHYNKTGQKRPHKSDGTKSQASSDYVPQDDSSSDDTTSSSKKEVSTKRNYTHEDEIQILKTLITCNPVSSISDRVVSSLKRSIGNVTKKQLSSKVSKMKKSYLSNKASSRSAYFYQLCSCVWSSEKMNNNIVQDEPNKLVSSNLLYEQPQFDVSGKSDEEKKQLLIQWLTFRAKEHEVSKQIIDILLQALAPEV